MVLVLELAIVASMAGLLMLAAVGDIRHLRSPKWLVVAVVALYPAHALCLHALGLTAAPWWEGPALLAGAFVLALLVFQTGIMGGGDLKLMMVLVPWAGFALLPMFLIIVAIGGGLVAVMVLMRQLMFVRSGPVRALMRTPVPYGVAIAGGGLYVASQLILNALAQ